MEHLFSVWPEMAERVRGAGRVVLLTDFDGTLSHIAGRPEEAVLPDDTRQGIEALSSDPRVGVAVISGRRLDHLERPLGLGPEAACRRVPQLQQWFAEPPGFVRLLLEQYTVQHGLRLAPVLLQRRQRH